MLRDNIDRLRDESRDERERRDARNYYMTGDEPNRDANDFDNRVRQDFDRRLEQLSRHESAPNQNRLPNDFGNYAEPNRRTESNRIERASIERIERIAPPNSVENRANSISSARREDARPRETESRREMAPNLPAPNQRDFAERSRADQNLRAQNYLVQNYQEQQRRELHQPSQSRQVEHRELVAREQTYGNQSLNNASNQIASSPNQNNRNVVQRIASSGGARARDVMSRNVAVVSPNDSAQHAARLMRDCDCGAIPVIDRQGRMNGMVTDRDITVRLVAAGADPRTAPVRDCMTERVFVAHENDLLDDCLNAMSEHQIRRIVVVDNEDRVVGIISQSDVARHAQHKPNYYDNFTNMVGEISEPSREPYR